VHTYSLADAPVGLSLTETGGDDYSEKCAGLKAVSWEMTQSHGTDNPFLTLSVDWLGESTGGEETAVSATYPPITTRMLASQCGGVEFNGVTYQDTLIGWTLRCERQTQPAPAVGQKTTSQPFQNGPFVVTLEARIRRSTGAIYTAHRAGTTDSSMTIAYTGSGNYAATITMYNGVVSKVTKPLDVGNNEVIETVTWQFYGDSSNPPVKFALTNNASDPLTN